MSELAEAVPFEPGTRKGLAVDDDPDTCEQFADYLRDAGLTPMMASSLHEAEELLDRHFFHVSLVDLSLVGASNTDGHNIIRRICQELDEGGQAILITVFGKSREGHQAASLGAYTSYNKDALPHADIVEDIKLAADIASAAIAAYDVGLSVLSGAGSAVTRQVGEYDVIETLSGGHDSVDKFVRRLLRPIAPLLRLRQHDLFVDRDKKLVRSRLWSKILGAPVDLLLGTKESLNPQVERFRAGQREFDKDQYSRLVAYRTDAIHAGAVFETTGPRFEAFDTRQDPRIRHGPASRRQRE